MRTGRGHGQQTGGPAGDQDAVSRCTERKTRSALQALSAHCAADEASAVNCSAGQRIIGLLRAVVGSRLTTTARLPAQIWPSLSAPRDRVEVALLALAGLLGLWPDVWTAWTSSRARRLRRALCVWLGSCGRWRAMSGSTERTRLLPASADGHADAPAPRVKLVLGSVWVGTSRRAHEHADFVYASL